MLNIYTLTWNGLDKLIKLRASLIPCLKGIDYQWWIKDNGSTDGTVEAVSKWDDRIHVVAYKNNVQNFSQGMNFIFNESKPNDNDLTMLLNNDVVFGDTSSINKMIGLMNNSDVGMVGARLLFTGTDKLQHAGVVFNPRIGMPMHFRANEKSDDAAEKNRVFQVVTGAVALTRADLYKNAFKNKSGTCGMDESYHWAFDDVDLCLAINVDMKKKVIYCGGTKIFHEESATLKKNPANKLFMSHNVLYFKKKWDGRYNVDQAAYSNDPKYNLYK